MREPLTREMVTLRTLVDENLMTPRRTELVAAPPRIAASSPQTRTALGYLVDQLRQLPQPRQLDRQARD